MFGRTFFESVMMLCFFSSWVFAIRRSVRSRANGSKSLAFLFIILIGYVSGIIHKVLHNLDGVVWLYSANAAMVATDIALWFRNRGYERRDAAARAATAAP